MKSAPAIALLVVGAGISGWMLELPTAESEHLTMTLDEATAGLGAWLLAKFRTVAKIIAGLIGER